VPLDEIAVIGEFEKLWNGPLLKPPNSGKQKRNRVYLKVALTMEAGQQDKE